LLWLAAYDVTLNWRRFMDMFGRLTPAATWAAFACGLVVLHLLSWPVAAWFIRLKHSSGGASAAGSSALVASIFVWMIAQSLLGTARVLQERASLDLILGSPISARLILASRAMAVAASSFGSVAILVLPVANMAFVLDGPAWLAVYPTLVSLALFGTAAGSAVAIGLYLMLPPRRARLTSQLCAAFVGGAFLLALQIAAMLPAATRDGIARFLEHWGAVALLESATMVPVAALHGELSSILWLSAISLLVFSSGIVLSSAAFVRASLRAAGAPESAELPNRRRAANFGDNLGSALRRKEWRLLRRDPNLFAQLFLQITYTVPLAVVLVRGIDNIPLAFALSPAIVVIAAQVAASLAWITLSGEDAPELIAGAPVRRAQVEVAKITAIGAPILLVLALPLAGLALLSPSVALVVLIFAAAASTSTALLNLWHPMPGNRRGMLRRHSQSKVMALLEHLMAMLWAVASVLAVVGTAWAFLPIALVLLLLAGCNTMRGGA
jgi:ABC-2 type transport system permease protein